MAVKVLICAAYPEAGSKAVDFAYLYFVVQEYMPAGMVGLLIAAMFAATMSLNGFRFKP